MNQIPPPPPPPPERGGSRRIPTGAVVCLVLGVIALALGSSIGTGPYRGAYPEEDYILTLYSMVRAVAWFSVVIGVLLVVVAIVLLIRSGGSNGRGLSVESLGAPLPGTGVVAGPQQESPSALSLHEDLLARKRREQAAGILQVMQAGVILWSYYLSKSALLYLPLTVMWTSAMPVVGVIAFVTGARCFLGKSWGRRSVFWLQLWFILGLSPDSLFYAFRDVLFSYVMYVATLVLALRSRGGRSIKL